MFQDLLPTLGFALILTCIVGGVTGTMAQRKGYAFGPWFMAGGLIALVVLAFLPDLQTVPEPGAREVAKHRGNSFGTGIAVVAWGLGAMQVVLALT